MARLKKGILGGISGTIGEVVGGHWKGIEYIRSKASDYTDNPSQAQLDQRMKFRLVGSLLKSLSPVVRIGFRKSKRKNSAFSRAMSLNLDQATTGSYPDMVIDPEQLVLSNGSLPGTYQSSLDLTTVAKAVFHWADNSLLTGSSDNDSVILVLYNTDREEVIYQISGIQRSEEQAEFALPESWSGTSLSGYVFFASVENDEVSKTFYIPAQAAA